MTESSESSCPYCGELVEVYIDEPGGGHQEYVEDCPVCCQPWQVLIVQVADEEWTVTLRTADE